MRSHSGDLCFFFSREMRHSHFYLSAALQKIQSVEMSASFQRGGHVISFALVLPHAYYRLSSLSSVMLASQRWHTEDHFRLVASHRAMPSLCPLPSAANTGGEAILLPWEVSLRKRGSAVVLVTAGLGLKNRLLVPKPPSWHLGVPGARHRRPLSSPASELGRVGGLWARVQRVSAVPCCPTGNDTQPVPSPSRAHRRPTARVIRRCRTLLACSEWSLHYRTPKE